MTKISLNKKEVEVLLQTFPKGLVALDLETTGLSPVCDRIIEIAAVKLFPNGQIATYETLINPEIPIPAKTTAIHNITDEMVKNSPKLLDVLIDFKNFIGTLPLVAHNAKFDTGFVVYAYHQVGEALNICEVYDSIKMARTVYKKDVEKETKTPENYKLGTLATFFDVELLGHHRAMNDALACLKVFAHTISILEPKNLPLAVKLRSYLFNLDDFKQLNDYALPDVVLPIYQKILNDEIVTINYKGGTKPGGPRPIKPLAFLPMPQGIVLYAQCLTTNLYKSYSVKKIKGIV
ncbi:MAG: PolC-type DNA polymerase III [Bacteriovoracaceae bacterium]